jgi:hypothetical protein
MAQLTGKVAIYGINGTVAITGTGVLDTDEMAHQSAPLNATVSSADIVDGDGDVVTRAYYGEAHTIELEFVPYDPDTPGNLATLKSKVKIPAPGTKVTLASFDVAQFNGDWNYAGQGSITPNQRGFLSVRLTLTRPGVSGGVPAYLVPQ